MQENFDIFDFALDSTDIEEIAGLDQGEDGRTGPHPDTFAKIPS
jgi:2,5-diketo-D-gluconate reductase A